MTVGSTDVASAQYEVEHARVEGESGTYELRTSQIVERPLEEVFAFYSDARNLELLTPSWLSFRILEAPEAMATGVRIKYQLRLAGFPVRWMSEISDWSPPDSFTDIQLRGPYARWEHTHRFTPIGDSATEIADYVVYRPPGGPLAPLIRTIMVRRQLDRIFGYRAKRTAEIFSGG